MSGNVHPIPGPSFPVQCALKISSGGVGRCNAAPAPNGSIEGVHFSLFLDSKLLEALASEAVCLLRP